MTFHNKLPLFLLGGLISFALQFTLQNVLAAAPTVSQVQAVYLNGYAKFIVWPETAFPDENASFHICVLGENPFANTLDLVVADERLEQRSIEVNYIRHSEQISICHILYISSSERVRLDSIISAARAYPILTVSDLDNFVQHGGMIQFYIQNNRVRFFIDPITVRESGLEPNANLLRISDVIKR